MSDGEKLNDFHHRDTVPRWRPFCWKCRDGRTRAHHRLCSKRGGRVERFIAAYQAEALAAFRGSPSPRRLNGLAKASAVALGQQAAHVGRESQRMLDRIRPARAKVSDLRALAALFGVERSEPAAPVYEVA